MNQEEFKKLEQLDTATLVTMSAELDRSHHKHAALHILEIRRAEPLRQAAEASTRAAEASARSTKSSAHATIWAAIAAFISALAGVISLFHH